MTECRVVAYRSDSRFVAGNLINIAPCCYALLIGSGMLFLSGFFLRRDVT